MTDDSQTTEEGRLPGFYWVKINQNWEPAEWTGTNWNILAAQFQTCQVWRIGPRIDPDD